MTGMIYHVDMNHMSDGASDAPDPSDAPEGAAASPSENRKFYGAVKVGERGQIVVPADARSDFGIAAGDRLLVFGDLESGLWVAPVSVLQRSMEGQQAFYEMLAPLLGGDHE